MKNAKYISYFPHRFLLLAVMFVLCSPMVWAATFTVTWMDNGALVSTEDVEEGNKPALPATPTDPSATRGFVGWTANDIYYADVAPSDLFNSAATTPAVTADVTYNAVYADMSAGADATASFIASNISATPLTGTLTWTHTASGIAFHISDGEHYTSGTPNTFRVSKGSSNYGRLTAPGNYYMSQVVATMTPTVRIINSVSGGWTLNTDGSTQTVSVTGKALQMLEMFASSSNQIRFVRLDVTYHPINFSNYTLRRNGCSAIITATVDPAEGGDVTVTVVP